MLLTFKAYKAMSRMVRFGLMPRQWMTNWEHHQELERQRREVAPTLAVADPSTCLHPVCRRYGNIHGSFSKRKRCQQRFKWVPDREGWVPLGSPQLPPSSHLPPPSSSTILPIMDMPTKGKGKTSSRKGTTSKARAKPKARPAEAPRWIPTSTHHVSIRRPISSEFRRWSGRICVLGRGDGLARPLQREPGSWRRNSSSS